MINVFYLPIIILFEYEKKSKFKKCHYLGILIIENITWAVVKQMKLHFYVFRCEHLE